MFASSATVNLSGTIDQARLDALRSALGLRPEGRLTDGWDEILGRRVDDVLGGRVQVVLYREDYDGPWSFHLNVEGEPSAEALSAVTDEVTAAAVAAGMTVVGVSRRA